MEKFIKNQFKQNGQKYFVLVIMLTLLVAPFLNPVIALADNNTYTYDFWGIPTPMPDTYRVTDFILGDRFGIGHFSNPRGLHINGSRIFVVDTNNNRVVVLQVLPNDEIILDEVIEYIVISGTQSRLNQPHDVFVKHNGEILIADTANNRVLHVSENWGFINEIIDPESVVQGGADFLPENIVADQAGRMFVQARHINRGLMEFDNRGVFVGYMGANPVNPSPWDQFWRFIATQEQRAQMMLEVPTEYNSLSLDHEGFLFVTNATDDGYQVRRLNSMGSDVLIRNGHTDPIGDLWISSGGQFDGASRFVDVTTLPNGIFITFDQIRGRLFAYDFQGHLLYAFGGAGNREGSFIMPVALESMEYTLFALDANVGAITRFDLTEYGMLINNALAAYRRGLYDVSADYWREVLRINGNFEPAHIGIARSLLRQGYYREAMRYFSLQNDRVGFGRAFGFYRRIWIEERFWIFITVVAGLIVIPPIVRLVINLRKEFQEIAKES